MIATLLAISIAPRSVHILLIGASDYVYPAANGLTTKETLSGDRDVVELKRVLTTRVFAGETNVNCKVISEKVLDRERILSSIDEYLVKRPSPGDAVVFWWSGHGIRTNSVDGADLQAIVPPQYRRTPEGALDPSSLVYGRELSTRFESLEKRGIRTAWFLDSCFSGNAARTTLPNRLVAAPVLDAQLPPALNPSERKSLQFSATSIREATREISIDGQKLGLLTALVCRAFSGQRGAAGGQYSAKGLLDLMKLDAIALGSDSTPEAYGDLNQSLFSDDAAPFTWRFPAAVPSQFRPIWLEGLEQFEELDPDKLTIPAGLMDGLREGDFAEMFQAGETFKFVLCTVTLGYSQMVPISHDLKAKPSSWVIVYPKGQPRLFAKADSLNPLIRKNLLEFGARFSTTVAESTHRIEKVASVFSIRRRSGETIGSAQSDAELQSLLYNLCAAERIRAVDSLPNSSIVIQIELVKLNPDKSIPFAERVISAPWTPPKVSSRNDCFTVRFRLQSKVPVPPRKVHVGVLYTSPKHLTEALTNSADPTTWIEVGFERPTEWLLLTRFQGVATEAELVDQETKPVCNFTPDPKNFDLNALQVTIFVAESKLDLSSYTSPKGSVRGVLPLQIAKLSVGCYAD